MTVRYFHWRRCVMSTDKRLGVAAWLSVTIERHQCTYPLPDRIADPSKLRHSVLCGMRTLVSNRFIDKLSLRSALSRCQRTNATSAHHAAAAAAAAAADNGVAPLWDVHISLRHGSIRPARAHTCSAGQASVD